MLFNTRHAHVHCIYWLAIQKKAERGGWLQHSPTLSLSYCVTMLWARSMFSSLAHSRRGDYSWRGFDALRPLKMCVYAVRDRDRAYHFHCGHTRWTHRVPPTRLDVELARGSNFFCSAQHMAHGTTKRTVHTRRSVTSKSPEGEQGNATATRRQKNSPLEERRLVIWYKNSNWRFAGVIGFFVCS